MIPTLLFENFKLLIYYFPWVTAPTYFNGIAKLCSISYVAILPRSLLQLGDGIQIQKITAIPVGQISPYMAQRFETAL